VFVYKDKSAGIQNPTQWDLNGSGKIVTPLCYRSAVFFHSLRFIALSFPQIQSGAIFKGLTSYFLLFFNCKF
jgi:hypothetical protein